MNEEPNSIYDIINHAIEYNLTNIIPMVDDTALSFDQVRIKKLFMSPEFKEKYRILSAIFTFLITKNDQEHGIDDLNVGAEAEDIAKNLGLIEDSFYIPANADYTEFVREEAKGVAEDIIKTFYQLVQIDENRSLVLSEQSMKFIIDTILVMFVSFIKEEKLTKESFQQLF